MKDHLLDLVELLHEKARALISSEEFQEWFGAPSPKMKDSTDDTEGHAAPSFGADALGTLPMPSPSVMLDCNQERDYRDVSLHNSPARFLSCLSRLNGPDDFGK